LKAVALQDVKPHFHRHRTTVTFTSPVEVVVTLSFSETSSQAPRFSSDVIIVWAGISAFVS
jgi:hypothetical protein